MKSYKCTYWFSFLLFISLRFITFGQDSYPNYFDYKESKSYSYQGIVHQYQFIKDGEKFMFENTTDSFIAIICGIYKTDSTTITFEIDTIRTIELIKELNTHKDQPLKYSLLSRFDAYRDWQIEFEKVSFCFYNRKSEERLFCLEMQLQEKCK